MSRGKNVLKTILCKLYQISFILSAAEILEKTSVPCEIRLCDKYFNFLTNSTNDFDRYSISSMLVQAPKTDELYIELRRKEFEKYCKYIAMKQVVTERPKKMRIVLV
ncbi:hypothetical protein TVAG_143270 [Trichomonas vaginalis G3]|uniref:Uncharacterized protein n=1 Tax=Trichomonas vaginalis (strain ATCC PRA-98 / G3) TaxID=412133 RepID=A2EWC3_TRIV3|nr:hypothetical protein TVAGG3_0353270 [Trichomonas vaginalis G3]EAY03027.1 hypothetical protein TVAG_143270 [Trichomonas vaginalis G3]KAI5531450.1 hypothetical protein TVAGG3_0353270 [Trichomonas vaginalis G3]|eukprot:XP_001315250.1 hypothetical protein [Trichomonas vaginalis G3]